MPKQVIVRRDSKAVFVPMKRPDTENLCRMDVLSGCGIVLDPKSPDSRKRGRRGCCLNDYQVLRDQVADNLYQWEEAEQAGLCNPRKRDTSKKVLRTIVAIRRSA